jgi:hypothetical protein
MSGLWNLAYIDNDIFDGLTVRIASLKIFVAMLVRSGESRLKIRVDCRSNADA